MKVTSSVLREKAYMGIRLQIEYGATIWDPRPGVENNGAHKIEMVQRWTLKRWTLKKSHNTSSVSNMLQDLLYKIHHGHVPINASKYLRPMTRRSRHSHSNSYIPLSTSTSSHRLSFYVPKNYYPMDRIDG